MIIIHPNGAVETKPYEDFNSIVDAVNPPEREDPFTTVPLPDRQESGYVVYANDNGRLIRLPRNPAAEKFTGYPELFGPICVASFEESGEDECMGYIVKKSRDAFEKKLAELAQPKAPAVEQFVFDGEYAGIPAHTQDSLKYYALQGQPTGGFLEAMLSNDLEDATIRADLEHRRQFVALARWIHFKAPGACHGSRQAYKTWIKQKGLKGVL